MPKLAPGLRLREGAKKICGLRPLMSPPISKYIFLPTVCMLFMIFWYCQKMHNTIKFIVLFHCIAIIWITKSANQLNCIANTSKRVICARSKIFGGYYTCPSPISQYFKYIYSPPTKLNCSKHRKNRYYKTDTGELLKLRVTRLL